MIADMQARRYYGRKRFLLNEIMNLLRYQHQRKTSGIVLDFKFSVRNIFGMLLSDDQKKNNMFLSVQTASSSVSQDVNSVKIYT